MMIGTLPRTPAGLSSVTVETIREVSGFAALQQEWNELLQASDSDGFFLTWEWLYTWWKHLSGDRQLFIVVVRCEGVLSAVAPCCLSPQNLSRRRLLPVLEFLGNGSVGSDYLDVIVRRGHEQEARLALSSSLAGERLVVRWTQLKRGGSLAAGIASALVEDGWSCAESETNICPFIRLAGKSWESYLATLGAEHRYNFHRKWKRLNRDYIVSFEQVRTQEQCGESIDLVIAQHNLRWRDRGGSDAFHTPGLVEFHREFCQVALEHGWLRLYVLRLDGRPAACLYGFLYGRTFYFYQSGLDAAYNKQSAGLVTMGLAIRSAIEEGAEEYDLLHGNEAYKAHWSRESRKLGRLEVYPPRGLGWICRYSVEVERGARGIVRRMLPKGVFA
jgi:CelD/BcsL family acetyltransferase involved in cellulose biosynthesis